MMQFQKVIYTMHNLPITKTCPCNLQRFFTAVKMKNFQIKRFDNFLIFAQNIDCGYPQSMF